MKLESTRNADPLSANEGINMKAHFFDGSRLPLVVDQSTADLSPTVWAEENSAFIEKNLLEYGAILFRGFELRTVNQFEAFAQTLISDMHGEYGDLPKRNGTEKIYKSTPYSNEKKILFHNESSHLSKWPRKQCFFCEKPSPVGGATPIVDCRRMYDSLPSGVVEEFEQKGLVYVRTFHAGLDVAWQDFFNTDSIQDVAEQCARDGTEFEFVDFDVLQIRTSANAVISHPLTKEKSFFNQVQLHHSYWLQSEIRKSLVDQVGENQMPRNVFYGDLTEIPDSVMKLVGDAYEESAVRFAWQQGDVLLMDNMLVAHARDEYEGDRSIAVAMGEMVSASALPRAH